MFCLAVAFLLAAAVPVAVAGGASPRPQARAAADVTIWTSSVPVTGSDVFPFEGTKVYSPQLTAGVTYRLVATGTVTQTGLGVYLAEDAVYCFDVQPAGPACSPLPFHLEGFTGARLVVREEGVPSLHNLDALNPAAQLPYDGVSHRYEETFTATRSGRLEAYLHRLSTAVFSYQGGFTLELKLPGAAGSTGPPTGPSGGGSPGAEKPATVLPPAKWGKPGPSAALGPGDAAIAPGPKIASGQTEASVTVSGDAAGETHIVLGVAKPGKKLTGGDCVRAAVSLIKESGKYSSGDELALNATTIYYFYLAACLEYVRELDKQAKPVALRPAVGAARLSCGVRMASLSVRVDRAAKRISYRSRRASRRGPARRLRVSCRKARNGAVTMRVRTRSRRTKLRKVLGKQLVVGLYRPRAATGTANVRTTFKRR
jgi:hypothetical protein